MTSREIAELTGKRHDNVLRDIRAMITQVYDLQDNSVLSYQGIQGVTLELDAQTKRIASISLDKDHTLTLLTGYDAKARFKVIQRWQELEAALSTPSQAPSQYITSALPYAPAFEIQIAESAARILRMSDTSKIRMLSSLCDAKGINPNFLPAYVDEPLVKAITTLLKEMDHPLGHHVARVVNPTLEKLGILEHLSRKGRGNEIKRFWNLTAEGLQYGRNETSPNNPRETQPLFFVDRFPELLQRLEAFIADHALLTTNPQ
ncbi:hypothetical protein CKO12_05420 [Chromatium okenii]|nr:hypothetical protein [Chromatium okenii]